MIVFHHLTLSLFMCKFKYVFYKQKITAFPPLIHLVILRHLREFSPLIFREIFDVKEFAVIFPPFSYFPIYCFNRKPFSIYFRAVLDPSSALCFCLTNNAFVLSSCRVEDIWLKFPFIQYFKYIITVPS